MAPVAASGYGGRLVLHPLLLLAERMASLVFYGTSNMAFGCSPDRLEPELSQTLLDHILEVFLLPQNLILSLYFPCVYSQKRHGDLAYFWAGG